MSYNSLVLVREVWDTRDLIHDVVDEKGNIIESNLQTRFEPEDLNALEMALKIKDQHGGAVTAVSLGASKQIDVLRECLYRGADDVLRVNFDKKDADIFSSAKIISEAIKSSGIKFDLLFSGVDVVEGENLLLGTAVSSFLGINSLSYIDDLEELKDGKIICKRAVEMGYEILSAKFPVCLNVGVALLKEDPRMPRSAKAMLKLKKKKQPINTITPEGSISANTYLYGYKKIEQKQIESKTLDFENPSELKQMFQEALYE